MSTRTPNLSGWMSSALLLATLLGAAPLAQAGGVEDSFRGFIDRMKANGQRISALPLGAAQREITTVSVAKRVDTLPLGREQYVIFVAPGCRSCAGAVKWLQGSGLNVEVLDLSRSVTAREAFALTGAKGVPSVLVGARLMQGWNQRRFEQSIAEDFNDKGQAQQGQGA